MTDRKAGKTAVGKQGLLADMMACKGAGMGLLAGKLVDEMADKLVLWAGKMVCMRVWLADMMVCRQEWEVDKQGKMAGKQGPCCFGTLALCWGIPMDWQGLDSCSLPVSAGRMALGQPGMQEPLWLRDSWGDELLKGKLEPLLLKDSWGAWWLRDKQGLL